MMLLCVLMNEHGQDPQDPGKIVERRLHDGLRSVERETLDAPARPASPIQNDEGGDETRQEPMSMQVYRFSDVLQALFHAGPPALRWDCPARRRRCVWAYSCTMACMYSARGTSRLISSHPRDCCVPHARNKLSPVMSARRAINGSSS